MMTVESSVDSGAAAVSGPPRRPALELGRCSVAAMIGLLGCTAGLVAWRRLAAELGQPLKPPLLLLVGGLVVVVALGVRVCWHRLAPAPAPRRWQWAVALLPTMAVLVFGLAVSLPGTKPGGLIAFWVLLAGGELWAWRPAAWRKLRDGPTAPRAARPVRVDRAQTPSPHPALPTLRDHVPADEVLQQLTRSRTGEGREELAGWLREGFACGQRTASAHVEFCPPFSQTPQLKVEQVGGPPARIKTAQLLPYGVRLELKLAAAAEKPESVLLQFSARSASEG